jgi:uncharacterized membrane protein
LIHSFFVWLQATGLARTVSETYFPAVESIHVVALTLVAGTIFVVDLRLIGVASRNMRFTQLSDQMLPWTWRAFVLAAITGSLLLSANAEGYYSNTPLRIKAVLLLLAGLNMAYFQLVTFKTVSQWDNGRPVDAARFAGWASLILWTGVIACGRWAGFV